MGAPKKADWREERRKRAWKLKEDGWSQQDIAAALGVSEGAVSQWIKRGREREIEALKAHPRTALNSPTLSPLADPAWLAMEIIIDEDIVRHIMPQLYAVGARGIVEYPINKIIL